MTSDAQIDCELVGEIAGGSHDALAALYDRHAPQMLGLASRILGNRRDAEDLLHDLFLEVWRKAADFDSQRGNVRGWLLLRTRSRAIDRTRSRKVALGVTASIGEAKDVTESGDIEPSRQVEGMQVRRALQVLSPEQRTVIELSYFEGLSGPEIAVRCQIPVGTVKSRMATALSKLRQLLVPATGAKR